MRALLALALVLAIAQPAFATFGDPQADAVAAAASGLILKGQGDAARAKGRKQAWARWSMSSAGMLARREARPGQVLSLWGPIAAKVGDHYVMHMGPAFGLAFIKAPRARFQRGQNVLVGVTYQGQRRYTDAAGFDQEAAAVVLRAVIVDDLDSLKFLDF